MKKTALHTTHESLGAKMVPFAGYEMPLRYRSEKEEHQRVRQSVGVFDVSHMGEFFLEGASALDLIQRISSNDAATLQDGQAQYSCLPNDQGGIVDDLIIYRLAAEKYMLVVNASNIEKDWQWIMKHHTEQMKMTNASDDYALLAVQGPRAEDTLQPLTDINLSAIPFYTFKTGKIAGADEVIVSATGYTGAGGFELYVKNADAEKVWNAVLQAGKPYDILPIGLGARDTLRMEMGYCLYGNDITETTSPLEAGLGWITKFTKDFTHAEGLKKQKAEGVKRRLVGFVMEEKGIPRKGYAIANEQGDVIGEVTSGTLSPSMDVGIGLGYVPFGYHRPTTPIFVQIRGKAVQATVTKLPLYKK